MWCGVVLFRFLCSVFFSMLKLISEFCLLMFMCLVNRCIVVGVQLWWCRFCRVGMCGFFQLFISCLVISVISLCLFIIVQLMFRCENLIWCGLVVLCGSLVLISGWVSVLLWVKLMLFMYQLYSGWWFLNFSVYSEWVMFLIELFSVCVKLYIGQIGYVLLVFWCLMCLMWYSVGLCRLMLLLVMLILVCRVCVLLGNLLVCMWWNRLRFFLMLWLCYGDGWFGLVRVSWQVCIFLVDRLQIQVLFCLISFLVVRQQVWKQFEVWCSLFQLKFSQCMLFWIVVMYFGFFLVGLVLLKCRLQMLLNLLVMLKFRQIDLVWLMCRQLFGFGGKWVLIVWCFLLVRFLCMIWWMKLCFLWLLVGVLGLVGVCLDMSW